MPSPEDCDLDVPADDDLPHLRRAHLAGLMGALLAMPGGLDARVVQGTGAPEPILHATNPAMAGRREQVVCREVDMGGGAGSPRLTGFWVDDLVAAEARDWPASFIEVITDW